MLRILRLRETPSTPSNPSEVDIKNCKHLFSRVLAGTLKRKARISGDIISAGVDAFF